VIYDYLCKNAFRLTIAIVCSVLFATVLSYPALSRRVETPGRAATHARRNPIALRIWDSPLIRVMNDTDSLNNRQVFSIPTRTFLANGGQDRSQPVIRSP
ncbi:MAG: hypothetical protein LIQ31_11745, partial [Planctomycetes bacterium]|nr:hypothetical protein [Planctomycetota bacterium]